MSGFLSTTLNGFTMMLHSLLRPTIPQHVTDLEITCCLNKTDVVDVIPIILDKIHLLTSVESQKPVRDLDSIINTGVNNWDDGLRGACYGGHLNIVNLINQPLGYIYI